MASFNVHVTPADGGKVTVNVSPSLQKRLESYDLNPWNKPEVESFPLTITEAQAEATPAKD